MLTCKQKELIEGRIWSDLREAKKVWPNLNLHPSISYKLSGRTAGQAKLINEVIKLNPDIANHNFERFINRTPGHELAHLIAYQIYKDHGHGQGWKRVMRMLGYEPNRCHSYDMTEVTVRRQARFTYKCGCDTFEFSKTRHNKNIKYKIETGRDRYSCRSCKEKITLIN